MHQGQLNAAAWKNTVKTPAGQSVDRLTVRVERRYKKDDGVWESSSSYTLNELYALQHFVGSVIDRVLAYRVEDGDEVQ